MLYSEESVRANIRNKDGKRVFYLRNGDTLTPSARDWLQRERIQILLGEKAKPDHYVLENGGIFQTKPEHFTHLRDNILVPKSHPIIAFRGAMDSLQAELLLAQQAASPELRANIGEILALARNILRWDVMEEAAQLDTLCGLSPEQLRSHSHDPQKYYGQPHFMPEYTDGPILLQLNRCRCATRTAELAAAQAFIAEDGTCRRTDLLQAMNRMSSMLYILMIRQKANK
jgi:ethanolamine utilization cobalamin adenosyltransferase